MSKIKLGDRIMYAIINNAELPAVTRAYPYPFINMQIGDGFDAPDDLGKTAQGYSRRLVSIKNGIAKARKEGGAHLKFIVGPHREDSRLLRCVRIR